MTRSKPPSELHVLVGSHSGLYNDAYLRRDVAEEEAAILNELHESDGREERVTVKTYVLKEEPCTTGK